MKHRIEKNMPVQCRRIMRPSAYSAANPNPNPVTNWKLAHRLGKLSRQIRFFLLFCFLD